MKRRKVLVVKFKEETGCLNPDCHWDGAYDAELLDFHHLDQNTKTSSVSKIRHYGKKFKEEIAKCTLLCANCHRGPDGWHGTRLRWKLRKFNELLAINETLRRLA